MPDYNSFHSIFQFLLAATPEDQKEALREAYRYIHSAAAANEAGLSLDEVLARRNAFSAMLSVGAFESAALLLVPEGELLEIIRRRCQRPSVFVSAGDHILWDENNEVSASTIALAIAAAAVRAKFVLDDPLMAVEMLDLCAA